MVSSQNYNTLGMSQSLALRGAPRTVSGWRRTLNAPTKKARAPSAQAAELNGCRAHSFAKISIKRILPTDPANSCSNCLGAVRLLSLKLTASKKPKGCSARPAAPSQGDVLSILQPRN